MDLIWQKFTDWLKEVLVGGVMDNLTGLFDTVNTRVGEIAGQVGTTPQGWNSGIYNMIRSISDNVILPIAGIILAVVMTMELIQIITDTVEIWKRFRKWGGIPSGITQNVKDLLSSREVENIFENSDYIYMLNQASGDRQILAKQLNISPHQLSYVTHSGEGEGLLFYGNIILPFIDHFPRDTELYRIMTTKLSEVEKR